jgi:hypothetical protein
MNWSIPWSSSLLMADRSQAKGGLPSGQANQWRPRFHSGAGDRLNDARTKILNKPDSIVLNNADSFGILIKADSSQSPAEEHLFAPITPMFRDFGSEEVSLIEKVFAACVRASPSR